LQIPEFLNLEEAHDITTEAEERIRKAIGNVETSIHIEPPKTQMLTQQLVEQIATRAKGVVEAHDITAAYTSGRLYITLHVQVNPKYSVQETHEIAENIENEILGTIKDVENVTVHVEPFTAKSRKGLEVSESEINETVRKAAETFEQAFKVRKIETYVANKKRYINIDGYFTRQTSIEDAHTIASQIENKATENFQDTIVTVHMEPEPSGNQTKDSKQDQ
jgi:divalent metal cation (Fe/Co/Zn/Cd) transporter